ncbi:MAG: hypothetical protein CMJ78_21030 [Planctomycetaceae bacterium]|nr:hypothetical protein [Planctomycetaceae bacterium]
MNDSGQQLDSAAPIESVQEVELLGRFVEGQDEAAFRQIVVRHGPLVIGVCRRMMRNEHDAEDVIQATFLVLARKANRIRKSTSLGSWLYGVAYRLSMKAGAKKRSLKERLLRTEPMGSKDTLEIVSETTRFEM